jgi:hypothetical protein
MNNQEKIVKLTEIRNSIKQLVTEYNDLAGEDIETNLILLTYGMSELYTQEQIDKAFDGDNDDYGMIDGEYVELERVSVFGDEKGWLPSSLYC